MGMPSIGLGAVGPHGMPRIKFGEGDFAPKRMVTAVTAGTGFEAPRRMGLIMVVLAVGLMIVNMIAYLFTPGGLGLRDGGPIAILFSLVCIVIASKCERGKGAFSNAP